MKGLVLTTFSVLVLMIMACEAPDREVGHAAMDQALHDEYVAVLHPTMGNEVQGTVRFMREGDGVRIVADVHHLDANSLHGFHIHEFGDCAAPDGTSAGGHFDPHNMEHSGPDSNRRHAGDLGNLETDADGSAEYNRLDTFISLDGSDSILGRGVVIHAGEDDLESQPTGAAGGRLACGVIGVANTGS
ncbi:MAG: superoxide dismutase family protein [Balneolaceae bacterium]